MTEIHQFVATFAPRDGTGNQTIAMQRALRDMGFTSEIWVEHASREVQDLCKPYKSFTPTGNGPVWLLYQASTASPVADWFADRPEPKLVYHHNHTSPSFWAPWEPGVAAEMAAAWRQTEDLAPSIRLTMTHSAFTQSELARVGYRNTRVVPIIFDPAAFASEVDPQAERRLSEKAGPVWLFQSRLMPHKRQHALVKALALYRRTYDPTATLRLVGSIGSPTYHDALLKYRADLGLEDAVTITGPVSNGELVAHYRTADVYVSASEHEGFGIGLIEAMHNQLPVVAVAATAVPETVGGAALCVRPARTAEMAVAVHRVLTDVELRRSLVDAGNRRVADFAPELSRKKFADAILSVVQP